MRSSTTGTIACGLRRLARATEAVSFRNRTLSACGPLRPSATEYSTRAPTLGLRTSDGSADEWRKTSAPSSPVMKPKPRSASKNLTLPVGMVSSFTP